MSEPQKKNNFDPARLNWFNLDNRYATKQDLINSNRDIRKDIKLSDTKTESQISELKSLINESNTQSKTRINELDAKLEFQINNLSTSVDAKIVKSQLSIIKWVITRALL